ncbi:MAG: 50S ribosomal protein L10 [Bacteroidaceae bacterium]|jgi:large subunit ribosomal protein L10|nr:50S ribosomal protein L10 [Bacteroidaceae bacterium]
MKKEDKVKKIAELGEIIKEYAHFYLVDVTAMDAAATSAMRAKCFKQEIKMVVVKNTLLERALKESGIDFEPLFPCLKGTTAMLLCNTANAPAKLIKDVAGKGEIPALKGAYAEESFYVGADQLETLIHIKSKNELIAEVVALLQSPIKNVVSALQSGGNTIHGVLKTLGERE